MKGDASAATELKSPRNIVEPGSDGQQHEENENEAAGSVHGSSTKQASNIVDEETDVRESGPLESNDPMSSTGKIETFQSATMTQRNQSNEEGEQMEKLSQPEMMELPHEVIKSSRTKVVEVNLPPRGTLNSSRVITSSLNNQMS